MVLKLLIKIFNFFSDSESFYEIDAVIFKSFQLKYSRIINNLI